MCIFPLIREAAQDVLLKLMKYLFAVCDTTDLLGLHKLKIPLSFVMY